MIMHVMSDVAMADNLDNLEVESFLLDLAESVVSEIKSFYERGMENDDEEDKRDDLAALLDEILQFAVLVLDDTKDVLQEVLRVLRKLSLLMNTEIEGSIRINLRGRPKLDVREDQLHYLIEQGFRIQEISHLFGCSRKTIERRMNEYQMTLFNSFNISDNQLDAIIKEITTLFPRSGEKTVSGRLRSYNIRVPRRRVRESLQRVDPSGIRSRCKGVLQRRKYYVECPNSLWHLDGYHKLIRWRIVIHGGIDGFSRLITYLKVAPNNRAETVLQAFLGAVQEFGLPSRVKTDRGGENVAAVQYLESLRAWSRRRKCNYW